MAMTVGSGARGVAPQMNVTPLVDIVLVLLIIFMVITPLLAKTFWIHTPKQERQEIESKDPSADPNPPLVLRVGAAGTIEVNGVTMTLAELPERLRRMFAARDDHVLFFDAADDAEYGFAVAAMDQARAGGAVTVAALTRPLAAAPAPQSPSRDGSSR